MSETSNTIQFKANIILKGKIECLTGLHIGGSKEKLEIGGVDSPVLRHPGTKLPYIPGSSIKGKMRTLLEYSLGVIGEDGGVAEDPRIVRLFGLGADDEPKNDKRVGPSRLIFRDSNPDNATIEMWKKLDSELLYTEYKAENTINRLTSAANPRFIERVVAGSKFDFEVIYAVFDRREDGVGDINQDLIHLIEAMRLLENNFLGKSGTRGYGQVRFHVANPIIVKADDYRSNSAAYKASVDISTSTTLSTLEKIALSYSTTA
jgi:CRISPR-associated protein Csm3